MAVEQLEAGQATVENQYVRSVRPEGAPAARALVEQVFQVVDRKWRGIGEIPASGLGLRPEFQEFDAERKFGVGTLIVPESGECLAGQVLQGKIKPSQCPAFGTLCTPDRPLGAPMVSTEGACSAYHAAGRLHQPAAASR